ncbi:10131_t:CDS:1 [Racocetra fulgida]|uniref:10131_t:CDS:1 n=1 Tax=Racocetra fulgida TaxID=60492 RepID=A0A9N9DR94_9GLOM|nr:10131_t:CDS:1 [Racocetra fulgida]
MEADHMTEISETARPGKILPIPEEDSLSTPTKAEINVDYDDVYFDEEFDYDSTPRTVKEMNKEVASQSVKIGDDSDSDESIDSNHPIHDILLREEIARLERISNSPGNSAPTPQMTPAKADNYDDVYFDEEDLKEEEVETNKVKSDNENNSEEEMPDESDDDGYSGCGGYNEYGESDRGYYYDLSSGKKTYKNSDYIISAY